MLLGCVDVCVVLLSGSVAYLRREVDEGVAGLGQLCDGHSASLSDELSHSIQLLWSDGDKLPSVIYHTCRKQRRDGKRGEVQ